MAGLLPTDFYNGNITSMSSTKSFDSTPPLLKDYLIDLDTGYLVKNESGQFTIVNGLEAIVMQIWRKLHTPKGVYEIFSKNYGNTFNDLIGYGKGYADSYASSKLTEAIVDNVYVKSINNVKLSLEKDCYTINFTINTIYGDTSSTISIPLED
jgi:hypothetical protein